MLLGSFFLSTALSFQPLISFWGKVYNNEGLWQILHYLIWAGLIYLFFTKNDLEKFCQVILASAIFPTFIAFGQKIWGMQFFLPLDETLMGRVFGTLGQPNFFGQFLALVMLINLFLIVQKPKQILYYLSFLIFLAALFFTGSRAGFLTLSIGAFIYLIPLIWQKKHLRKLLIGLAIGFTLTLSFFVAQRFDLEGMRSINSRLLIWESIIPAIQTLPPTGYGLETFEIIYEKYKNPAIYEYELFTANAASAHNIFLDVLMSRGYIGIIIFLVLIVFVAWHSFKKRKTPSIWFIFSVFAGWLAGLMFSFSVLNQYLILIGLAVFWLKFLFPNETHFTLSRKIILIPLTIILFIFAGVSVFFNAQNIKAEQALFNFFITQEEPQKSQFLTEAAQFNSRQRFYLTQATVHFLQTYNIEQTTHILKKSFRLNNYLNYKDFLAAAINHYYLTLDITAGQEIFGTCYALAPNEPSLYLIWGDTLLQAQQYETAAENYETYLALLPPYWQWDEDIETRSFKDREKYRKFFKAFPDFRKVFKNLAEAYAEIGDEEKSLYYQKFILNRVPPPIPGG